MRTAYPEPKSHDVSLRMKRNRKTNSKPEVRLRSELHRRGLRFRKNAVLRLSALTVRPDIVFRRERLAVFVDGCYWHRCPEHGTNPRFNADYWQAKLDRNVGRDREVDKALMADGWLPLRFWEHESPAECATKVMSYIWAARSTNSRP
jgi:DNA mismatch endonuclease (patch repair protein)